MRQLMGCYVDKYVTAFSSSAGTMLREKVFVFMKETGDTRYVAVGVAAS